MEIRWVTAFIDMTADRFDEGVAFWQAVTRTERSWPRGAHDEFATLVPSSGDAYLRVQRTADGSNGVHLDLHVASIGAARDRALDLGAALVAEAGHAAMRSPAGLSFCIVADRGEATVPVAVAEPVPHRVDQVSIDIPPAEFDSECGFWHELTGWPMHQSPLAEFRVLERPPGMPLRLLLQRLDADDGRPAGAHLDIACGPQPDGIAAVAESHVALGATRVGEVKRWLVMQDPVGQHYCLTPRDPVTGMV